MTAITLNAWPLTTDNLLDIDNKYSCELKSCYKLYKLRIRVSVRMRMGVCHI